MSKSGRNELVTCEKIHGNGTITIHRATRDPLGLRAGDLIYLVIPTDQEKAKLRYEEQRRRGK